MLIFLSILVMGLIGAAFGLGLAVLDKKLRVHEDPAVEKIIEMLPGLNCGACGQAGCAAYAKYVVKTKDMSGGCLPAGDETNQQIATELGISHESGGSIKLITKCSATSDQQTKSFEYVGPQTCVVSDSAGGNIDCKYGCLALGDCIRVCPVDALSITDGQVVIDNHLCVTCGNCVKACPRLLFQLIDPGTSKEYYTVGCNNPEDALSTKKVCKAGCIGCSICIKLVKDSPYYLEEKISRLDYEKAAGRDDLALAQEKCPVKIIKKFTK